MADLTKNLNRDNYPFLFHYYRAEVNRVTSWRNRLDVTTNWAIVITAAILSFVFGEGTTHAVVILNYLMVWFFLYIESRRFRYYTMLNDRVKIIEKNLLGPLFSEAEHYDRVDQALEDLSSKLMKPKVTMSRLESVSWRLRRNYIFILISLFMVWMYRVITYPKRIVNIDTFFDNASIEFIPGWVVFFAMYITVVIAVAVAFYIPKKYGHSDLP